MSLLTGDAGGGLSRANALKAANRLSFTALWLKILGLEPLPRPGPALHHRARRKDASPEVRLRQKRPWPLLRRPALAGQAGVRGEGGASVGRAGRAFRRP